MATDIAFALGVLALIGKSVPASLKVFLLTLAIADDVGAIAVIAVFYSGGIQWPALLVSTALLAGVAGLRWARVFWGPGYVLLGVGIWVAFFESGVHATLAGVALGLLVPARPLAPDVVVQEWSVDLAEEPSAGELKTMTKLAKSTVSVTERLQHMLHPVTSYLIVPLFALANAGVVFQAASLQAPGAGAVAAGAGLALGGQAPRGKRRGLARGADQGGETSGRRPLAPHRGCWGAGGHRLYRVALHRRPRLSEPGAGGRGQAGGSLPARWSLPVWGPPYSGCPHGRARHS